MGLLSPELPMNSASATAKQEVEHLLQNLPDDATLEDIQYHLYVLEKIKRGMADVAAGRVYTDAQARERMGRWLQS
jgi:predicted transcriptional regulator